MPPLVGEDVPVRQRHRLRRLLRAGCEEDRGPGIRMDYPAPVCELDRASPHPSTTFGIRLKSADLLVQILDVEHLHPFDGKA